MRVRTGVTEIGTREVRIAFEILLEGSDKISAKGYFVYILVDAETGRARTIPDPIREKYSV